MGTLIQDLRYGLRMLARNPGFTAVAVITLALGIGANTAIFSVVNPALIHALPYRDADRLVLVGERTKDMPPGVWWALSAANFLDWEKQNHVFEGMAAAYDFNVNLTGQGEPVRLEGKRLTTNFLPLLGVQPAQGRSFVEHEDNIAILSHRLWARRFGSDPNVIGRAITLNDESYTVVGVMPSEFRFFPQAQVFLPNPFRALVMTDRTTKILYAIARLAPSVTLAQAQAEMNTLASRVEPEYPADEREKDWGINVIPLYDELTRDVRPHLLAMVYAVGFVLLIACANLASLLLARGAGRQREMGVRAAVGASRVRLIRQTLTENVLLSLLGGTAGLLIAYGGVQLLLLARADRFYQNSFRPHVVIPFQEIHINWQVLGFTLGLSLLTGLLFGLAPAVFGSKPNLNECLKESGTAGTGSLGHRRALTLLVIGEIALSLVLLTGAGLLICSVMRLLSEKPGFDVSQVLRIGLTLPLSKYTANAGTGPNKLKLVTISPRRDLFITDLIRRLKAIPGVESAAAWSWYWGTGHVRLEGEAGARGPHQPENGQWVSPGYFRTMGIRLLKGRDFTEQDTEGAPAVAIINEEMARGFWPGQQLVGRRMISQDWDTATGKTFEKAVEIVAIAASTRDGPEYAPGPEVYFPYFQWKGKMPDWQADFRLGMTFLVRTSSAPTNFAASVQKAVWDVDKFQPISEITTMQQSFYDSVAQRRFYMQLLIVFAGLALLLAAVGVYGVMSYSVTRRTHEIGVRKALGATPGEAVWLVVRQGLMLILIAVPLGLAAALGLTRFLSSFLYGVKPNDPATFVAVSLILAGVATLACYIPARRAAKFDPMVALRHE